MIGEHTADHEELAALLRLLAPAPEAWVCAAQELPRARREVDGLVARAERDAAFRATALEDLERALREAGITPDPALLALVRARLGS